MKATWKIGGVKKVFKRLSITESVSEIGDWSADRAEVENLIAFTTITVEREGVEIFGGRVERPDVDFSRVGSEIRPSGFDYTIKLTDYLAPEASLVDTDTATALATIISNTPFVLSIESVFSYIAEVDTFDTTLEFLGFTFNDACIEYDPTDIEVDYTIPALEEVDSLGFTAGRTCFYYDGPTKRFYNWYVDINGDLFYSHTVDGITSTEVDSGINPDLTAGTDRWSVAWYNNKVWVFANDTGILTDLWRGTINDGTGAIAWDGGFNPVNNIFASAVTSDIRAGPVFDDSGHIWILRDDGSNGEGWESTDNGATWNLRFTGVGPPNKVIFGILPTGVDGDIYAFVWDIANDEIQEWLWDRSTTTFGFNVKIADANTLLWGGWQDCASFIDNVPTLTWIGVWGPDAGLWYADKTGGVWGAVQLIEGTPGLLDAPAILSISCDQGITAYVFITLATEAKIVCYKIINRIPSPPIDLGFYGQIQTPRTCLQDGEVVVFLTYVDSVPLPHFIVFGPSGIRITRGQANGWFRTDLIDATGGYLRWGFCVGDGVELEDTEWDVLEADNTLIPVGNQHVPFNIDEVTGGTTEDPIKIRVDLTDTGTPPYVFYIGISEVIDELTLDLDYEDVYTAMRKWIALSGGEIWLDKNDVLHVAATRGSDKSDRVILKNSKTSDYPDVEPNIMVVSRDPDWAPYANAVKVIGAGTGTDRVEAEIRDTAAIAEWGEHWYCHRDPDIQTVGMAFTVGLIELARRSVVMDRIIAIILDEYDPGDISIGDTVHVVAEFGDDVATKLDADMRVVSLSRSWDAGGEHVTLELVNLVLASEYWRYLTTISDLMRWITV